MSFSENVKTELILKGFDSPCCSLAFLSAFFRGSGSVLTKNSTIGFEIVTESEQTIERVEKEMITVFGQNENIKIFEEEQYKKNRYVLSCFGQESLNILITLGILSLDDSGVKVNFGIDKYLLENECCKKAYIIGTLIGSGSVIIPSEDTRTSYHLEFVFSNYQTASDFSELLSSIGFFPKQTKRREMEIVYFKNGDDISSLIAYMGAVKSAFQLQDIIITKEIKNDTNRKVNCEMGNLTKQIDASVKYIQAIELIEQMVGLSSLPSQLQMIAKERMNNPDMTLQELADSLSLTKSCVNHRLRKLQEIAENLK